MKMETSGTIIFCIAIFCGIISCFEVVASNTAEKTCTLRYYKSKGILPNDITLNDQSPFCQLSMPELFNRLREDINDMLVRSIPNEANCASMEIAKRERTQDVLLAIRVTQVGDPLTESEKMNRLAGIRNELKRDLAEIATKCGIAEDTFMSFFRTSFEYNGTVVSQYQ